MEQAKRQAETSVKTSGEAYPEWETSADKCNKNGDKQGDMCKIIRPRAYKQEDTQGDKWRQV